MTVEGFSDDIRSPECCEEMPTSGEDSFACPTTEMCRVFAAGPAARFLFVAPGAPRLVSLSQPGSFMNCHEYFGPECRVVRAHEKELAHITATVEARERDDQLRHRRLLEDPNGSSKHWLDR